MALAGPWPLSPGTKLTITSLVANPQALHTANEGGLARAPARESPDAFALETYGEWGLGGEFTGVLKIQSAYQSASANIATASYEFGLRRTLRRDGGFILAAQASLAGGPSQNDACAGRRAELRALIGWSGTFGRRRAFAALESGGRVRTDFCLGVKTDAAFGLDLAPGRVQGLSQIFFDADYDRAGGRNRTVKFQESLVVKLAPKWSAQIGFRAGLTPQARERSGLVALWRRF